MFFYVRCMSVISIYIYIYTASTILHNKRYMYFTNYCNCVCVNKILCCLLSIVMYLSKQG